MFPRFFTTFPRFFTDKILVNFSRFASANVVVIKTDYKLDLHSLYSWNKKNNCDGDFYGIEMAEEYIPFLKIPYGFFILTPTPPPILRIAVTACVRKRDYLDSLNIGPLNGFGS